MFYKKGAKNSNYVAQRLIYYRKSRVYKNYELRQS